MIKETVPKEANVEYIDYKENNLPSAENIQDEFRYWKSQEKLDAWIALRNFKWNVKVSPTDTTAGYLEDKLVAWQGVIIEKQNSPWNENLKLSWEFTFWGDWSDWDLIIANGETVTITAATDITTKNYRSIDIQTGGTLTIQTTNTAPVVIKCLYNCTIAWSIDFNATYDATSAFSAFLLATGVTFTPTGLKSTNKWWTDLILNCVWTFTWTWWSINLWATSPWVAWALRIVTLWTYTAGTYTSSSTTVINKPTIF